MTRILLGLGANMGDRLANLRAAVAGLGRLVEIEAVSPVYQTAPMYDVDQDPYLNMALTARTDLAPRPLLDAAKALERRVGRTASHRYGPRQIDIDIVLYGDRVVHEPGLEVPHPRLAERAFVLAPAADIAAGWRHPATGRTIAEHLAELGPVEGVARLAESVAPV
ncbi:MAG: 2-amino-4-hydroxy-6-hydroxymethyldihydropteridine diphosphokinase [Inquilinus sp.]|nr:2-amino-4-hydroxy-6-hydroxymethyldihydropteridine diphosphokinase [Inquilinus sp.]